MKKWEIWGTCFQGNRGLEKYRQDGLFILHTALPSGKTLQTPLMTPKHWLALLLKYCQASSDKHTLSECGCFTGMCAAHTVKHVHCRCMHGGTEWKSHMLRGSWIRHRWSLAGDLMLDDSPHTPQQYPCLFSSVMTATLVCSHSAARLVWGGTGKWFLCGRH